MLVAADAVCQVSACCPLSLRIVFFYAVNYGCVKAKVNNTAMSLEDIRKSIWHAFTALAKGETGEVARSRLKVFSPLCLQQCIIVVECLETLHFVLICTLTP